MTDQDRLYLRELTTVREKGADLLEQPFMRGVKRSVVEKYSDQAHFIYELLQNADDACAENARFVLYKDKLIFAHNGKRHFSVSDPSREDLDSQNGTLGDINAITSIANSNKTEASIGKFGVGFKAVFQYTSSPRIYDPGVCFKIDRFIVPYELGEDYPGRKPDETLFVFPFDHPERSSEEAYADISEKLCSLSYPILFLSNLKYIEVEIGEKLGLYAKEIKASIEKNSIIAEKICLTQTVGKELLDKNLWLFSREYKDGKHAMRYSVGFFLDEEGHLLPASEPAFCFFPTKEVTNLSFIIHAPFLLTDSREGIRAGVAHNNQMIRLLATLAADSLVLLRDIGTESSVYLIDDDILDLIPVDESVFSEVDDKRRISFKPFYETIYDAFQNQRLLLSSEGYVERTNAYWAFVPQIATVFSNDQLKQLTENPNAAWVFTSFGRQDILRKNKSLSVYVDNITQNWFDEDALLNGRRVRTAYYNWKVEFEGISAEFIEKQSLEWLHSFYKWISETSHRTELILQKPVFLDQNGNAVSAFDEDNQPILFLPIPGISGYVTINEDLLKNDETVAFINHIGIKRPSLKDEIYNKILPLYDDEDEEVDELTHFKKFFQYYLECPQSEADDYIDAIKDCAFIHCSHYIDEEVYRSKASDLYFPTAHLLSYFESKPSTWFINWQEYINIIEPEHEKYLRPFFVALGVKEDVQLITRIIDLPEVASRGLPRPKSTAGHEWSETIVDGAREIIDAIISEKNIEKSVLLWNELIKIIETKCFSWRSLSYLLTGRCRYFYRTPKTHPFTSSDVPLLTNARWLFTKDGRFARPNEISLYELADDYETNNDCVGDLIAFLGLRSDSSDENGFSEDDGLSDEQREQISFAKKIAAAGIKSTEDIDEYLAWKAEKEKAEQNVASHSNISVGSTRKDASSEDTDKAWGDSEAEIVKVAKELSRRASKSSHNTVKKDEKDEESDADDYTPAAIDYGKQIERAKEKSAAEISNIAKLEELQKIVIESPKYSFKWFRTLLEIETFYSNGNNTNSREISISFARIDKEPGSNRILVLRDPDGYIPHFMEDLSDIPLVLYMDNGDSKSIAIDVVNVQSYSLRVKVKQTVDIDSIEFSKVKGSFIDTKSPQFLIQSLYEKFCGLAEEGFEDDDELQEFLPVNMEFVFGPPGTGKTTYLAEEVLIPLMSSDADCRVLALTPTNKAADVLVRRIMDSMGEDDSYKDWLIRFGATGDQLIEDIGIFKEKTFDIHQLNRSVTVTTIARFPYDYFMIGNKRDFLDEISWDYIIIDEASMIKLADIVYPLFKQNPQKFIIAGDPFQIMPISSLPLWKDENIYTMVGLKSFTSPKTSPYEYDVKLLTTQYRSIPYIGQIISQFSYDGVLKHARSNDDQKQLHFHNGLQLNALNIIKFPVSRFESIYRAKRLQGKTPYQIYSALFAYEFACYLANAITDDDPNIEFSIGIIAPYKAQADLIDKLIASKDLPENITILVGTVHGFQGDECDMIISVFNPPPSISSSKELFLNKQNIINVSISRARDYLILLMPDDDTQDVDKLFLIKDVEKLFMLAGNTKIYKSHDIEQLMFGSVSFLEDNTFSTSHQIVNVYGLPEKKYEIRSEDTAIDVQIHNTSEPTPNYDIKAEKKDETVLVKDIPHEEWVLSKRYGKGKIIERRKDDHGNQIIVDFMSQPNPKAFYEDIVFARGGLTRLS